MLADELRALVFDVFGTCVDWRGSAIRAGEALARKRGLQVEWPRLAEEWRRDGYIRSDCQDSLRRDAIREQRRAVSPQVR